MSWRVAIALAAGLGGVAGLAPAGARAASRHETAPRYPYDTPVLASSPWPEKANTTVVADQRGNAGQLRLRIPHGTRLPVRIRAYVMADVFPLRAQGF